MEATNGAAELMEVATNLPMTVAQEEALLEWEELAKV